MIARDEAAISAPASPWSARAPMSTPLVGATPPASDAAENIVRATTKVRRWPQKSPARPASMRKPAKTIA